MYKCRERVAHVINVVCHHPLLCCINASLFLWPYMPHHFYMKIVFTLMHVCVSVCVCVCVNYGGVSKVREGN